MKKIRASKLVLSRALTDVRSTLGRNRADIDRVETKMESLEQAWREFSDELRVYVITNKLKEVQEQMDLLVPAAPAFPDP